MKDVLTKIKHVGEFPIAALTQECSKHVQEMLPLKLKDLRSFTIPCNIGKIYTGKNYVIW